MVVSHRLAPKKSARMMTLKRARKFDADSAEERGCETINVAKTIQEFRLPN